jgi:glycosyltransferase involved in cell wall biosynthesis
MRVAIVHDWLVGGGAEKVVEQLHIMYPEAPIYTSYCTPEWRQRLDNTVVTGPLQHWPFSTLRKFIPLLRIWWFSRLRFDDFDLVISSSGAEAKGIRVPAHTIHVNYCHAPTHYYWSRYDEYLAHPGFGLLDPLARVGLRLLVGPLRRWDYRAAQRPNYLIANSTHTQAAIKRYYNRESTVIFPPVDTDAFASCPPLPRQGFVTVGRQTPYKRFDLAVSACTHLNLPLTVIGNGPDHERLKKLAGPTITFVTSAKDSDVITYIRSAIGFIFPGIDDFGITPVEALAAGTPVIALKGGGALDYIRPATGRFFNEQSVTSLQTALQAFTPTDFVPATLQTFSEQFSIAVFVATFQAFISQVISQ